LKDKRVVSEESLVLTHPNASLSKEHSFSKNIGASIHCIAQAWRQRRAQASYAITAYHGPRALKRIHVDILAYMLKEKSIQHKKKILNIDTLHEMLEGEVVVNWKMQHPLNQ